MGYRGGDGDIGWEEGEGYGPLSRKLIYDTITHILMGTLVGIDYCFSERINVDECTLAWSVYTYIANRALTLARHGPWSLGPSPGLLALGMRPGPDPAWDGRARRPAHVSSL